MTATYNTEAAKFSRRPTYLVKITVPGDVAGSQVFYFSPRKGPALSMLLGVNVFATLKSVAGRSTRIRSEESLTERPNITIQLFDDPNPAPFDSSVFSVTTGGTFWKRLLASQEYVEGWAVEISRGFYTSGFTLSDFNVWFKGRTDDISFTEQGEVLLTVKGLIAINDNKVPAPISDSNLVVGTVSPTATTITVNDGTEITNPSTLSSKDLFPVILRLDPDTDLEEDVIVKSLSSDTVTVQDNYLNSSEDLSNTTYWTATTVTVTHGYATGPFGGAVRADKLDMGSTTTNIGQLSSLTAASASVTFSIWLKTIANATSASVTLAIEDQTNSQSASSTVAVTQYWTRFEVTKTFTGGASGNVRVRLVGTVAGADCIAFGAQLETGTTRSFYAGTTTNAGSTAGRGAFGSTPFFHDSSAFKEVLTYRNYKSEEGAHPAVIIRDLINRGGIAVADVDETSFKSTYELSEALAFRRGRSNEFDPQSQQPVARDTTIVESDSLSSLLKEVKSQSLFDVWESEAGLVTLGSAWFSFLATDTRTTFTDEKSIVQRSTTPKYNASDRFTRVLVYFNKREDAEEDEKPESYENRQIHVNLEAETVGGKRIKEVFSEWIYRYTEAIFLASKTLSLYSKGNKVYTFQVDLRDDLTLLVGSLFEIDSKDWYTADGSVATRLPTVWRVIHKTENMESGTLTIEATRARQNKYGRVAPAGTPNYDSASAAEKRYCFISDTNGQLGAANDDGYVIL